MSSDRDHHTVNFNYGVPSLQPLQSVTVTPTQSPSGVPAPSQFQPYGIGLQPQIHTQQQLYQANTLPPKQPVTMPTGYNQYTPLVSSNQSQTYAAPGSQHSSASSASEQSSNYNHQPYRRENEFTHPAPLQQTTTTIGQYDSYQTMSPADEQRFQNEKMAFNRTNSALSFTSNSSQGQYQQPVADLPPRNLSVQEGLHNQRAFTSQPYENQIAYNNRNPAWNLNQQNSPMPQGNNGNSNGAMAYDYSRDSRFQSSPEYYNQQQYPYPYNSVSLPPQQYYPPMYQGYPPGYGPNYGYFSMAAQSGPIPASKPKVSIDEKTGEELITFSYSKQKVIRAFTIRVPTDHFDTSTLSDEFKKNNCVYPKAVVSRDQYKGNRYKYETECNDMGWTLSWFNEEIRDHRGLIQRAVDSWRNTRPDKSIRSRRARRDQDI